MLEFSDFVMGTLTGLVAIAIAAGIVRLYGLYREGTGSLAGEWDQYVPAFGGEPAKRDRVTCRHRKRKEKVSGDVRRIEPPDQDWKTWKFEGRARGKLFAACFWSDDCLCQSKS